MDLSVVVVNWNTKELLLQCLDSFYHKMEEIKAEVFVVDNGSVDRSVVAVREHFPEVILIQNQKNLGFARANNQALRQSKGKYLLLLNPDTRVKPGAIEKLVSFMEGHPEAGTVGAQLLNADGSKQNSIANFPSLATELLNKNLLRWLFPKRFPGKERDYLGPVAVESVIGACMMARRNAVRQVGWLDEDYFLFLEETDWCFRMKRAGWEIYHVPQAEIYHFQGRSAESEKKKAKLEYYRSRYHFFKKNRGRISWSILFLGVGMKLTVELLSMVILCLLTFFVMKQWRRRFSILVYLLWWHLRGCPEGMGLRPVDRSHK
jgi:GT2 family glycosyltransferase